MKIKKFKIILSLFLIIGIAAGGVLGYYDARLEAAVNNKNGSTLTDVKVDDQIAFTVEDKRITANYKGFYNAITEDLIVL